MSTTLDLGDQVLKVQLASADPVDAKLATLLSTVNEWLKFAEAKNGGAVGLGSGAIAILLGYLGEGGFAMLPGTLLTIGGICFLASVVIGIASFSPRTDFLRLRAERKGNPVRSDNLYFFGHLAKYSPRELIKAVGEKYIEEWDEDVKDIHIDLASQVTINARITMWKLRLFNYSVGSFGVGVLLCALGAAIHLT
jgi:hypothetical protein